MAPEPAGNRAGTRAGGVPLASPGEIGCRVLAGAAALLTVVGLLAWSHADDLAARSLARTRALAGRTAVVVGTLEGAEVSGGLPQAVSRYRVLLPAGAPVPEAGTGVVLSGDEHWGFPPSETFPPRREYLLAFIGGRVTVVSSGAEGARHPVTGRDVDRALRSRRASGLILGAATGSAAVTALGGGLVATRARRRRLRAVTAG